MIWFNVSSQKYRIFIFWDPKTKFALNWFYSDRVHMLKILKWIFKKQEIIYFYITEMF